MSVQRIEMLKTNRNFEYMSNRLFRPLFSIKVAHEVIYLISYLNCLSEKSCVKYSYKIHHGIVTVS